MIDTFALETTAPQCSACPWYRRLSARHLLLPLLFSYDVDPLAYTAVSLAPIPETAERLVELLAIDVRVVCKVPVTTAALLRHGILIPPLESEFIQRRHDSTAAIC